MLTPVQELVEFKFSQNRIRIVQEGEISAADIKRFNLIDQHYYSIASKATLTKPADLQVYFLLLTFSFFTPS